MKNIAVVCGGYSGESVISMRSASMVMKHMDRTKYAPTQVVVTRKRWFAIEDGIETDIDRNDFSFTLKGKKTSFDGVFMMIHGTPGENGLMHGYFDMIAMPYTTGNPLNLGLTFNKKMTTRVLGSMGFQVAKSMMLRKSDAYSVSFICQSIGLPCFVKPNCGGSSIGASRVNTSEELHLAIDKALKEDDQVIIEEFIDGTEVTNGIVVKNAKAYALPITEILSQKEFFDFEAKYQGASKEITPARLSEAITKRVKETSEDIFTRLDCRGMARIDYLIRGEEIFVVEVNTVPGFSEASIIPQQAEIDGMSKTELISNVIESCM
jgi:D-alanine-D-alanine ligase